MLNLRKVLMINPRIKQFLYIVNIKYPLTFTPNCARSVSNTPSKYLDLYVPVKLCEKHKGQYASFSTSVPGTTDIIDSVTFEKVCEETLDSLSEYFETLIENTPASTSTDITYSDGVLTVNFGPSFGTYVINRQSPNRQIWLSSPLSGPKRYDYVIHKKCWIYKHDGRSLHQLLDDEIQSLLKAKVNFLQCSHGALS